MAKTADEVATKAVAVIDRLVAQRANSTPRRDQFTITRRELEHLAAARPLLWVHQTDEGGQ